METSHGHPVFKKRDAHDLANYRPISLLSSVSRVFEGIVFDQLYQHLDGNGFLPEHQYGFRKYRSAEHACGVLANSLLSANDASMYSRAMFLDISKAFDHFRLLQKLKYCGLDALSQSWLKLSSQSS